MRRPLRRTALGLLLLLLLAAGWVGARAYLVRGHLVAARAALLDLRTAVVDGDDGRTAAAYADAAGHAAAARRRTGDPLWALTSRLPLLRRPARTARGVAGTVDDVVRGPLRTLVDARASVDPARLRRPDGSFDLAVLAAPQPRLAGAQRDLESIEAAARRLPARTRVGALDSARVELVERLAELRDLVGDAEAATRLGPGMLGGDRVRRYFVAFLNNAEARGTGGFLGSYGVLEADRGRLRLSRVGSNRELRDFDRPVLRLDDQFENHYRGRLSATTSWGNANLSPHFPYAGLIWLTMWERQFGQRLDGAVALDPGMLSRLLAAIGPVRVPTGETITAENVVELTQRTAYERYAATPDRKEFLELVARAVAQRLLGGGTGDPAELTAALRHGVAEGRLRMWSRHDPERLALRGTALGGALSTRRGPYAHLVVNNAGGNKLDFYLERAVEYRLMACDSNGRRRSRITATLTNAVPDRPLPPYVAGISGRILGPGTTELIASVYLPIDAEVVAARVDGAEIEPTYHSELGRGAVSTQLRLRPGERRTLELELLEPVSAEEPDVPEQPLVRTQQTEVVTSLCAAGSAATVRP